MASTVNQYPLTKFYFKVTITDLGGQREIMSFQEVTGLEGTREKHEYREGDNPSLVKKQIPGMKTFGELTLKKGVFAGDNKFFEWFEFADRRNVLIELQNQESFTVISWNVAKAFPTKFTSTDLNAENNEIAVEQLTLAHEGITVEHPPVLE